MLAKDLRSLLADIPDDEQIMIVSETDQSLLEIETVGWVNERGCHVIYTGDGA